MMKSRLESLGDIAKILKNSAAGGKPAGHDDKSQNRRCVVENGEVVRVEKDRAEGVTFVASISPLTAPCVLTNPETGNPMAVFPAVYVCIEGTDSVQKPPDDKAFDMRLIVNPMSALGLFGRLRDYFEEIGCDLDLPLEEVAETVMEKSLIAAQELLPHPKDLPLPEDDEE